MNEDMRGLFFIVKGKHRNKVSPHYTNTKGDVCYIGGYDPYGDSTEEWYRVVDKDTYTCVSAGSDLESVVKVVYDLITRYKDLKHYHKHITRLNRVVSPLMNENYKEVYHYYGDFLPHLIEEQEDLAYEVVKNNTPYKKAKRKLPKVSAPKVDSPKPTTQVSSGTMTLTKVTPKKKLVKKLKLT